MLTGKSNQSSFFLVGLSDCCSLCKLGVPTNINYVKVEKIYELRLPILDSTLFFSSLLCLYKPFYPETPVRNKYKALKDI